MVLQRRGLEGDASHLTEAQLVVLQRRGLEGDVYAELISTLTALVSSKTK